MWWIVSIIAGAILIAYIFNSFSKKYSNREQIKLIIDSITLAHNAYIKGQNIYMKNTEIQRQKLIKPIKAIPNIIGDNIKLNVIIGDVSPDGYISLTATDKYKPFNDHRVDYCNNIYQAVKCGSIDMELHKLNRGDRTVLRGKIIDIKEIKFLSLWTHEKGYQAGENIVISASNRIASLQMSLDNVFLHDQKCSSIPSLTIQNIL